MSARAPVLVALAIVERADGHVLVRRREPGKHLAGKWEFPGGKVEHGEDPVVTAARELFEECGLVADEPRLLGVVSHVFDDGVHVVLLAYRLIATDGAVPRVGEWVPRDALAALDMPSANARVLALLNDRPA